MNEITYVKRRELLNNIRQEHNPKRQDIHSTFGIRMIIAALLLIGYFFLESSKVSVSFLNSELIRREVNRYSGLEINLFDFMDNITYTFNNDLKPF